MSISLDLIQRLFEEKAKHYKALLSHQDEVPTEDDLYSETHIKSLYIALFTADVKTLASILQSYPALVFEKDDQRIPAVAYALCAGPGIFKAFLDLPSFNSNRDIENGLTLLHLAAQSKSPYYTETLLQHKADVNVINAVGYTPLHFAAEGGHAKITQLLLGAGANFCLSEEGISPQALALAKDKKEVFEILNAKMLDLLNKLEIAIRAENIGLVESILEANTAILFDHKNSNGDNLLHIACATGNNKLITYIKDKYPCLLSDMNNRRELPYTYCPELPELMALKLQILKDTISFIDNSSCGPKEIEGIKNDLILLNKSSKKEPVKSKTLESSIEGEGKRPVVTEGTPIGVPTGGVILQKKKTKIS